MSMKLNAAMERALPSNARPLHVFHGLSAGLNATSRSNRMTASMFVLPGAVIVGHLKGLIVSRAVVQQFAAEDILEVREGQLELTGIAGAVARKSKQESVLVGHNADITPGIILVTRHGDLDFTFKRREAGRAREAFLAISEKLIHPDGNKPRRD